MTPAGYKNMHGLQQARAWQLLRTPTEQAVVSAKTGISMERLNAISEGSLITLIEAVIIADACGVYLMWLAAMVDFGGIGGQQPAFPRLVLENDVA